MTQILPIYKTIIKNISKDTILIENLYYDLIDNQFIVNNDEIYNDRLKSIFWQGRNNPREVGKPIICKNIIENSVNDITIGDELNHVFIARRYSPHNFGHLLCETAIPIEYIFNSIGIKNKSDRAIIFDDSSWDGYTNTKENSIFWFEGDDINRRRQCDLHSNNIFDSMASTIIFDFSNYITEKKNNMRFIRIKNKVIFGIGNISPWVRTWNNINISDTIDSYVERLYNKYLSSVSYTNLEQNTLTFIIKIGRRQVLNWKEVGEVLHKYANEKGMKFEQFNLDDILFNNQIEILSRTRFLVTNGGSPSFSSLFLPKTKTTNVLYFPILNNNFESNLFKSLNRFNLIEYEKYHREWKTNIKQEDGSYLVNLEILSKILYE
jgi:hypothetical protein